jgi:hypothetical protein
VFAELVGLQVQLGLKHDELLLDALAVHANVMVLLEVLLERVVVEVVMRLPRVSAVADETTLVLIPAVLIQLVAIIEARAAETAQRMPPKASLVDGARLVVAVAHMLGQLLVGKRVVLVRKHFLGPGAQVAHLLVVDRADVAVQVLPAEAGKVAFAIGAVVPEQKNRVAYYVLASIPDPDVIVGASDFGLGVFLVALRSVVGEDDKRGGCLQSVGQPMSPRPSRARWQMEATHPAMRTVLALVQSPQAQRTNVACNVVAGGDRVVGDGAGADEAHLDVAVGAFVLCVILDLEVW